MHTAALVQESDRLQYRISYTHRTYGWRTLYTLATSVEKAIEWGKWYLGYTPDQITAEVWP